MPNEEYDSFNAIPAPGSDSEDSYNTSQVNAKVAHRPEKLARFRIHPALIKFPKGAPVIEGGYAIVSRALLSSPLDNSEDNPKKVNSESNHHIVNLDSGNEAREAERTKEEADHVDEEGAKAQRQGSDGEISGLTKTVAVKKMKIKRPDEVSRVLALSLREAEVLAGLSHDNIIKLEGFFEDVSKEIIWLIFPWEDNGTLKDFIASADWEIPERIWLIDGVAQGVEYLHSRVPPICHADLKSINILVNGECCAVITDFGSAHHPVANTPSRISERITREPQPALPIEAVFSTSTNTITLTGIQCTTRWAAPEVLENDEFSLASDIWALGWVAYEVMTNSIPFHDVKEPMVINRVVRGDLPSISNDVRMLLIHELCSIVGQCWKIDPSERPTAKECRGSINWMPRITPSLKRRQDATGLADRSAELLMSLGQLHQRQSDYANASSYYTKALNIYADVGDRKGKADALLELAQVQRFQKEWSQASASFSEALEVYTDLGDKAMRANGLFGLAEIHRGQMEYTQSAAFYSECLQLHTEIGNKSGRAYALLGLAEVHRLREENSQAITFYSECLEIQTSIGDRQLRAPALWGLAEIHRLRNEYDLAMASFSEALRASTDLGNKYWTALTLRGMAGVQRDQSHYSSAIDHYDQAAELFKKIGNSHEASVVLAEAADVRRSLEQQEAT